MQFRSKRYKKDIPKVPQSPVHLDQAIATIKTFSNTKFDQSVDLVCHLGISIPGKPIRCSGARSACRRESARASV